MTFQGNPNVTITAINVGGGIACSRTSGQTPCFVQVSASAITATGTSVPYEDLEYLWNCGDPTGVETFTSYADGQRTRNNANSDQWGPEAAYVYRSAGNYTVTLTIRGKNGSGFTTAQVTQAITVTTFSASGGEWYFDSAAAGGGDGSIGSPFNTISDLNAKLASNTALHIKRGSDFSGTTGFLATGAGAGMTFSGLRLDAYGTGALPIINISSGTALALSIDNGTSGSGRPKSDIVVSNISLSNSGTTTASGVANIIATGNASAALANIYFDNCTLTTAVNVSSAVVLNMDDHNGTNHNGSNYGLWNCAFQQPLVPNLGNRQCFFGGPQDWFFIVGGSFVGAGSSTLLDHHIYPDVKTHILYRYINFGSGPGKNYNINTNWDGAGSLEFAEFILLSDNYFFGTLRAFDSGNGTNDILLTQFRNVVAQRNNITGLTADAVLLLPCEISYTMRDNVIWGCNGGRFYAPAASNASLLSDRIYRNLAYRTGGQGSGAFYSWTGVSAFTGGTRTFTDNVTYDTEVTAIAIALVWADVQAGSIINRNQWYAPNDGDASYLYDNATAKTFAQWQAAGFDANGSVGNPNWSNPASGIFAVTAGRGFGRGRGR